MSDTQDTPMEEETYDHGEELLLGGAKKLVVVSLTRVPKTRKSSIAFVGFMSMLTYFRL